METEDKIMRLLTMMEQPEQMDENELQSLLDDDECRQVYETMVKVDHAYADKDMHRRPTGEEVEAALRRFETAHGMRPRFGLHKAAAAVAGIVLVSGLTFATYHLTQTGRQQAGTEPVAAQTDTVARPSARHEEKADTVAKGPKTFDNVTLQTMLDEIAAYYQVKVEYAPTAPTALRLHYRWDREQTVEQVVETLNHFDHVDLMLDNDKLMVR